MASWAGLVFCIAALLLSSAAAQFVTPPTDLIAAKGYGGYSVRYKEVPSGICETVEGVKSYSGYVDVDVDQHIFFWFIEARNQDPTTAPLTIWLNGGPGDSSMVGLFSENGPCYIDNNGTLQFNPNSWNNVSNMIYIDQPTQVGFSYSLPVPGYLDADSGYIVTLPNATCPDYATPGTCGTYSYPNDTLTANSTPAAAPNVWRTLQGFMSAFPQYSRKGVHLSTESYGGHYGPIFAEYFETQNAANISGAHPIDLRSLSVGNGWFDPRVQYPAYYNYSLNNTYDFSYLNDSTQAQMYNAFYGAGNCLDQLNDCNIRGGDDICSAADNFCYDVEVLFDDITGRDEYDIRELSPDPYPYTFFVEYLNRPEVQQAMGAYQNFSYSVTNLGAGTVATAFTTTGDDARELAIINATKSLIEKGVYVLHYAGDADYNCNWLGGEVIAAEIDAPGFSSAGYQNLSISNTTVPHGVIKQSGNYAFGRIYNAGHSVPFYQPEVALTMFERMIKRLDIATGNTNIATNYKSIGPSISTYREGNSTIQQNVTDPCSTYDVDTDEPDPPTACAADDSGDAAGNVTRRAM